MNRICVLKSSLSRKNQLILGFFVKIFLKLDCFMSLEENSPLLFRIALLMAAVLKLKMLLGFISDSLFCTPSSDSLFRENTNEEDWNCLESLQGRLQGAPGWGRVSQFHEETQGFCRAVVLVWGINKEKPSAKKHTVHSLERLGPGIPRVGYHLEWVLGSS